MTVDIDLKLWRKSELSLFQYLILHLVSIRDKRALSYVSNTTDQYKELVDGLVKEEYIYKNDDGDLYTRSRATELFKNEIDFDEFWNKFPRLVPTKKGGKRPLRALGRKSKQYKVCRDKYIGKIKTIEEHNKIIRILDAEIKHRKNNDNIGFMNNIETYINDQVWEKYEYLLEENTENDTNSEMI